MSRKNAKKPARSIRYLLSADRRLKRLSLKRISARATKAQKPSRSSRPGNSPRTDSSPRFPWATNQGAIALGVIGVIAVAVLITAGQPSHRADFASVDATPEANAPSSEKVSTPVRFETKKTAASKAPTAAAAARPQVADSWLEHTQPVEPVKPTAVESAAKAPAAVEPAAKSAAVETASKAEPTPTAVTITGCLELDNQTFWLKDTSGADAPKSRSWRSGFLRKRSSSIELVDASNTLRLPSYVGRRVAATGVLTNGEMRPRSLQRIAASCSSTSKTN